MKRRTFLGIALVVISGAQSQSAEHLRAHHEAETDKWWPIIEAEGIKAQ